MPRRFLCPACFLPALRSQADGRLYCRWCAWVECGCDEIPTEDYADPFEGWEDPGPPPELAEVPDARDT